MPGINQLPAGSEYAAAISVIWALLSWFCASLLFWLTWAHQEGWSYLALLAISALISNTFSLIQQGNDITRYTEVVTAQLKNLQKRPNDPELAIAGGSIGVDLVLYYLQYYSYSVQAMLVMFWAAELCQLTYQIGERRRIRQIFRKLHTIGKFVSWLLPLATILCLRIPGLRDNFAAFIIVADLPLMLSLAIGSGLMIAVTIRYVQSRKRFTQWSPPRFNSATSGSEAGTNYAAGTTTSSRPLNGSNGKAGLYDRWLMVRFTIAFILLAVFEVTNTLFQVTALQNNISMYLFGHRNNFTFSGLETPVCGMENYDFHLMTQASNHSFMSNLLTRGRFIEDAKAAAPDLSAGRAVQNFFLRIPGTTPGIFLYIVFGTTKASRQKVAALFQNKLGASILSCFGRRQQQTPGDGGITIQRSLTVTSVARLRASDLYHNDDLSNSSDIWMKDLTKRSDSAMSFNMANMKPLPLTPVSSPSSGLKTTVTCSSTSTRKPPGSAIASFKDLSAIKEKGNADDLSISRTSTNDSLQVPDDYQRMGTEHSDDSGPILPIQRPEVRFSQDIIDIGRQASGKVRYSRNFSRPKR